MKESEETEIKIQSQYQKELVDACNAFDFDTFKAFWKKWSDPRHRKLDVITSDELLLLTYMKICANKTDINEDVSKSARAWLMARGYRQTIGNIKA
jgi:hypothetical protein